jgi:tetratricopeptide (TPR) repeat protein
VGEDSHVGGDYMPGGMKDDHSTNFNGPVTINNGAEPQRMDPARPAKSYGKGKEYEEQRDYPKAIACYEQALQEQEEATGPMSEDLARVHNTLGIAYGEYAARYDDAIEQCNGALTSYKAKGELETNLGVAMVNNNLGVVYDAQGEYGQALEWHKKALAVKEKALGKEHPDTAASNNNNIANVYYDQGEYGQAERYYNKALAIYLKAFGEDHPYVETVRGNLALLDAARGASAPG